MDLSAGSLLATWQFVQGQQRISPACASKVEIAYIYIGFPGGSMVKTLSMQEIQDTWG